MTVPNDQGKVLELGEAVRRFVKPGMKVHLAAGIGGPSAAICEIIRQFWNKNPEFTLIQSTVTGLALNLVHAKLVKKLICSVGANIAASGRPSKVIQDAYESKSIELENWTLNSLQQRLMAGAGVFGNNVENTDPGRYAGRGGLGAVMGSKRVVTVITDATGGTRPEPKDKAKFDAGR